MKQLIVDYLPFEVTPEQINESMKENSGKLMTSKVFYNVDDHPKIKMVEFEKDPREILEVICMDKYTSEFIKQR